MSPVTNLRTVVARLDGAIQYPLTALATPGASLLATASTGSPGRAGR